MKLAINKAIAPFVLGATFVIVPISSAQAQDRILTVTGTVVEGRIVEETSTSVQIQTRDFGTLRFRKTQVDRIDRGVGSSSPSRGGGSTGGDPFGGSNPFGGGSSSPASSGGDPFGGPNPFAGSGSSSAPTGGADPFGGYNPFAPGGSSPQMQRAADQVDRASSADRGMDQLASGPIGDRRYVSPPEVPTTWDAVLFAIPEGTQARARVQPGEQEWRDVSTNTNLRTGAVVMSGESTPRIVMKDGSTILRLAPRTNIRIAESTASSTRIELQSGSMWVEVPSGAARFIATSGPMQLESSGGVFRVVDAIDLGFHVSVVEGAAEVRSTLAQIRTRVPSGRMMIIHPNGAMSPSREITDVVRREDAQFDELPTQWWLQRSRVLAQGEEVRSQRGFVSINDLPTRIREVANAFASYARDTGQVPSTQDAFTVLRENANNVEGWNGPYLEGTLPPLDAWGRPMLYILREGSGNRQVGVVYSRGENNQDNGGDPSGDIPEMVLYYQIESVARASN